MANFKILWEYLKKVSFSSDHTPQVFISDEITNPHYHVQFDLKRTKIEEGVYEVVLIADILAQTWLNLDVFDLRCEYASLVRVKDVEQLDKETIDHILLTEVSQTLFPIMRNYVSNLTFNTGFVPVRIKHEDFEKFMKCFKEYTDLQENSELESISENKEEEKDRNTDIEIENTDNREEGEARELNPGFEERELTQINTTSEIKTKTIEEPELSYLKIVRGFKDDIEASEFYNTAVEAGINAMLPFFDTPMYKYLMWFIGVPEFHVIQEQLQKVDKYFFTMLFCMLAVDESAKWHLEKIDDELELFVTVEEFKDAKVSEMSIEDLKNLMTTLIVSSWSDYNYTLSNLFDEDDELNADLFISNFKNDFPTRSEYFSIFTKFAHKRRLDMDEVGKWYTKLEEIEFETLRFRF